MFTEFDFGVHTVECDMTSIVLTGANTVKLLVVELTQSLFYALAIALGFCVGVVLFGS